jgi:Secretion system C-terminal sorting domain
MKFKLLILSFFILNIVTAQNIFKEKFDTYAVSSSLSGNGSWSNLATAPGGLGSCASCTNTLVTASVIGFSSYGDSTQSIEIKSSGDGVGRGFSPVTSGSIYVGMVINISNASTSTNPSEFFRVYNGDNFNISFKYFIQKVGATNYKIGISKAGIGTTIVYTTATYNFNQDNLIVLKYTQITGTTNDVLSLFVNPDYSSGEPTTPDATTTALGNGFVDTSGNIDRVSFCQNTTSLALPTGKASLLSVALTWNTLGFNNLKDSEFDTKNFQVNSNFIKEGVLLIKSTEKCDNTVLNIFDLQGRKIENQSISLNENDNKIEINPISSSGIYIIVLNKNGKINTNKIIVN